MHLTFLDLAQRWGVSVRTVRDRAKKKWFAVLNLGWRTKRVELEEVERCESKHRCKAI